MAKSKWDWEEAERQIVYDAIDAKIEAMHDTIASFPVIPAPNFIMPTKSVSARQKTAISQAESVVATYDKLLLKIKSGSKPNPITHSNPSKAQMPADTINAKVGIPHSLPLTAEQVEEKLQKFEKIIGNQ